jgi:hypothetical protein
MAKGVKFGRKPKLTNHQRQEALARKEAGEALTQIKATRAFQEQLDGRSG